MAPRIANAKQPAAPTTLHHSAPLLVVPMTPHSNALASQVTGTTSKARGRAASGLSDGDEWDDIPSSDAAPSSAPHPAPHPTPQPAPQSNMDVGWAAYFAYQKGVEKGKAQHPAYAPQWSPQGWAYPPPAPPRDPSPHRPAPFRASKHVHSEVKFAARSNAATPFAATTVCHAICTAERITGQVTQLAPPGSRAARPLVVFASPDNVRRRWAQQANQRHAQLLGPAGPHLDASPILDLSTQPDTATQPDPELPATLEYPATKKHSTSAAPQLDSPCISVSSTEDVEFVPPAPPSHSAVLLSLAASSKHSPRPPSSPYPSVPKPLSHGPLPTVADLAVPPPTLHRSPCRLAFYPAPCPAPSAPPNPAPLKRTRTTPPLHLGGLALPSPPAAPVSLTSPSKASQPAMSESLEPDSRLRYMAEASQHMLAVIRKFAPSTLERYLRIAQQFLSFLEACNIAFHCVTLAALLDYLAAARASRSQDLEIHRISATSAIKALRWFHKLAQWEQLTPAMQTVITAYSSQSTAKDRKEALPIPMAIIAAWEQRVCDPHTPLSTVLILGAALLAIHASLRFGDIQRVDFASLSITTVALHGICFATKTTSQGQPFAVTLAGITGRDTHSCWPLHALVGRAAQRMLALFKDGDPDFLWVSTAPDQQTLSELAPASYCTALLTLRWAATLPWSGATPGLTPREALQLTLRSMKSTVLASAAQLRLSKDIRLSQGHHRDSAALYSRNDTFDSLYAQRRLSLALSRGWRPERSIARG
ncbi:unnamed protein product, partial [Symbiodinium sp. KB8]